ncbi:hypothetical protein NQ317_008505 [Molorchus minor]|uniref:Uncharacterized protein n=1 Tax=Molorchus minor TaxID=1323400 RepID=A0ABQ9JNR8_9CUCU|nr:hypothetical protein NQ317_008505 [Molorchus minor]
MYTYFQYEPIKILFIGPTSFNYDPVLKSAYMCVAVVKSRLTVYYIAVLIWKHRKPLSLRFNKFQKGSEPEDSSSTKTTELSSNVERSMKNIIHKGKNVQVERKIRTFKIVIALMTINALKMLNDFMCKICCCCFSNAEFEDFEKDNPFIRENCDPKKTPILIDHAKSTKSSRVKFNVAHQSGCSKESGGRSIPKY